MRLPTSSASVLASFSRVASSSTARQSTIAVAPTAAVFPQRGQQLFHTSPRAGKDQMDNVFKGLTDIVDEAGARAQEQQSKPSGRFGGSSFAVNTLSSQQSGPSKEFEARRAAVRRASPGQHYTPHSLAGQNTISESRRRAPLLLGPTKAEAIKQDTIYRLQLKPSKPSLSDDSYKNPALLRSYVSEMGKILPRKTTGLTRRSQRMIGKAVRRARAMGLIPVLARGDASGDGRW